MVARFGAHSFAVSTTLVPHKMQLAVVMSSSLLLAYGFSPSGTSFVQHFCTHFRTLLSCGSVRVVAATSGAWTGNDWNWKTCDSPRSPSGHSHFNGTHDSPSALAWSLVDGISPPQTHTEKHPLPEPVGGLDHNVLKLVPESGCYIGEFVPQGGRSRASWTHQHLKMYISSWSALGMNNYYSKFISNLSTLFHRQHRLLRTNQQ